MTILATGRDRAVNVGRPSAAPCDGAVVAASDLARAHPAKAGKPVLEAGGLRVVVGLAPLRISLRRDGRRLLRGAHVWAAEGTSHDRFLQLTEGVVADERLEARERVVTAEVVEHGARRLVLDCRLQGGRRARLELELRGAERLVVTFAAEGRPLRLALEHDERAGERFGGLGARHHPSVDHRGREVQLGADRTYTGPDCPEDMLELGGIPQGDYAPVPFLQSSRGYALWLEGDSNGIRFACGSERERVVTSARAAAGPLVVHVLCDPTPAARLRRFLRLTGLPPVQPEWGYGVWKSRDVHPHQDDVVEDAEGFAWHGLPLDAVVIDSPWETQYNTWVPNPHQFPDFAGMVGALRRDGVRTVVWVVPWTNTESAQGQVPPDPGSAALHREPASNYARGDEGGHFVRAADGSSFHARWWMGSGSPVDFTSAAAEAWWREQAESVLRLGVQGIKADDGEGYYLPDDVRLADGTTGATSAWRLGGLHRASMQRALDRVHPGEGVLFGRSGWTGQQQHGVLWAGDQASDFWSLRVLVASLLSAAASGFSNLSHDVGGYLGQGGLERATPELLLRWVQLGCFTPLLQIHGRLQQEPWTYDAATLAAYRDALLLHERLVPYVRAAAATGARAGLPVIRPLTLLDPADERGWGIADAYGYGPSLWVAPVVEAGARSREVPLPRGRWVDGWSRERVTGGGEVEADAPLERVPVWVRHGALLVTYPAAHVAAGLGDVPEGERPLEATLWGTPACGRAAVRLADGTRIAWSRRGGWELPAGRDVRVRVLDV